MGTRSAEQTTNLISVNMVKRSVRKWISNGICLIATVFFIFLVTNRFDLEAHVESESETTTENLIINLKKDPLIGYTDYMIRKLGLKPLDVKPILERNIQEPVVNDVLSFQYPIDIDRNEKLKCHHWTNRSLDSVLNFERTLLIVVISAAENSVKRDLVRRTWAGPLMELEWIQIIFLIGSTPTEDKVVKGRIEKEKNQHGDLVQVDVVDTYANLTLKSVAMLHWAKTRCPEAELVFKCDDDNYVNWNTLKDYLPGFNDTRSIYGAVVPTLLPERYSSQKHYVSRLVWPWARYPSYLMGGFYAIPGQAIDSLLSSMQTTPYFSIEDIYVTGLCAWKANLTLQTNLPYYHPDFPKEDELDACFVRETAVWQTRSMKHLAQSHKITKRVYRYKFSCKQTKKSKSCTLGIFCW